MKCCELVLEKPNREIECTILKNNIFISAKYRRSEGDHMYSWKKKTINVYRNIIKIIKGDKEFNNGGTDDNRNQKWGTRPSNDPL